MRNNRGGFTYLELLLVAGLAIVALVLLANFMVRTRDGHGGSHCASNLRQIGQAMLLYANGERNGSYPRTLYDRGGSVILTKQGFDCTNPFSPEVGTNNIGAALFLLLRTQDISSEVFTCPSADSERDAYGGGTNTAVNRANFADLKKNLSYSVANMYADTTATWTGFKWNNSMSPDYAVMADRNPGIGRFSDVFRPTGPTDTAQNQRYANSDNHDKDGQNVLFGEGHVEFVANPWVGVNKDNIYTRAGSTSFGPNFSPADANDSFLLPASSMVPTTAPAVLPYSPPESSSNRPLGIVLAAAGLMVLAVVIHAMASPKKKRSSRGSADPAGRLGGGSVGPSTDHVCGIPQNMGETPIPRVCGIPQNMGETPMPRVCGIPQNMGETPMPREAGNRPAGGVEGGFAFCDLIVLLAMLAIVFGVIVPAAIANRARPAANRVKCASNLRQIGQAMLLYANGEKDGAYPRTLAGLSGKAITTNQGFDCSDPADPRVGVNNVPASLFLLLRTQDISSEVFTCPSADSERDTFGGGTNVVTSRANFGDIERNLSYSVHNMFPDEAAARTEVRWNTSMSPEFAVMADKNPGVVEGSNVFAPAGPNDSVRAQHLANSMNHDKDGQNVLFGDGHAEFVANPWVGVKQDNIYTRAGSTAFGPSFSPADAADSFLLPAATRVTAGEVTERVDPATVVVLMLAMALVAWLIYRVAVGRRRPPQRTS